VVKCFKSSPLRALREEVKARREEMMFDVGWKTGNGFSHSLHGLTRIR